MTTLQIINIAKITQYLNKTDVAKGVLYGQRKAPTSAELIYMERKAIEWMYGADPSNSTLVSTGNYVYKLCKKNMQALAILNAGSGGGIPSITQTQGFPIYITQDNFTTATFYPNTNLYGNNIMVFVNEYNRYLLPTTEFTVSSTGLTITEANFNATTTDYNIVIEKVYS